MIVQIAFLFINGLVTTDGLFSNKTLMELAKVAIFALVLYIVIVPEGLALAVQIALSQSVDVLKRKSKILIKNHQALQQAGAVQEICVSKTGMLTRGTPQVRALQINDTNDPWLVAGSLDDTFKDGFYTDLKNAILCSSEVYLQP